MYPFSCPHSPADKNSVGAPSTTWTSGTVKAPADTDGTPEESCGGFNAFDLFELERDETPTTPPMPAAPTEDYYVECFADEKDFRVLDDMISSSDMTLEVNSPRGPLPDCMGVRASLHIHSRRWRMFGKSAGVAWDGRRSHRRSISLSYFVQNN